MNNPFLIVLLGVGIVATVVGVILSLLALSLTMGSLDPRIFTAIGNLLLIIGAPFLAGAAVLAGLSRKA